MGVSVGVGVGVGVGVAVGVAVGVPVGVDVGVGVGGGVGGTVGVGSMLVASPYTHNLPVPLLNRRSPTNTTSPDLVAYIAEPNRSFDFGVVL